MSVANPVAGQVATKEQAAVKVMVIDDSQTIRRTAETLLAREGYNVITASDGYEVGADPVET